MSVFVVIGMHGGGTSLISSILDALGINMHYNPKAKVRWYRNYEDTDFVKLNIQILNTLGGNWKNPPSIERVQVAKTTGKFNDKAQLLIASRSGKWGFKDPRTAITIPLIHPFLPDAHYIRVMRSDNDVAESIIKRSTDKAKERWVQLSRRYNDHIEAFLYDCTSPLLVVDFDKLLDRSQSLRVIEDIALFVGSSKIAKALRRIDYAKGE
jgi:hypothetical protein